MNSNLKVLLLEDLKTDMELIKRQVKKIAPNIIFTFATNKQEFEEKIQWGTYDVILSDYNLPGYNGLEALLLSKEQMPHIPFVFITGMLNNEEQVAQTVLKGAAGYILKDNLRDIPKQLPEILEKAKKKQTEEEMRRKKERRKKVLLQKITELLKKSDDFPYKKEIESALKEINN